LLAVANSADKDAAKEAVAQLSEMGHHPISLAVYDRQKLFRKAEFEHGRHMLNCYMHSCKEVVILILCFVIDFIM
jgi:hypothetical protein